MVSSRGVLSSRTTLREVRRVDPGRVVTADRRGDGIGCRLGAGQDCGE